MADKLDLLNKSVPLLNRYDKYLEWESQNSTISLQVVSQNLEIATPYVEAYTDMGKLDYPDEFNTIDSLNIDLDSLVLILKEESDIREHIYANYSSIILNTTQPIKALRNFIEGNNEPLFRDKLESITPQAYFKIAQYLKQVGIIEGTINKGFRGLLVSIGRKIQNDEYVSDKQFDWVVRAITHSNIHSLSVFTNEIIEKDFPEDYIIFKEIITIIETQN
ncbi:hypothetical protein [Patiriisocius hiemis]|uniref:Uncharacterized protein n=1 Tax=Patiriisocius hiemis TaxID=3075604 RepID=A0ABU2Y9P2_9FLAO|nr:hypothetical protein [Constantimarinum sp. W242]MDT0554505.1 hypothetical protein [Constantimarinum sp. W242]